MTFRCFKHLRVYELVSGASVNNAKSEIMALGAADGVPTDWNYQPVSGPRKVYIGADENEAYAQTWRELISKVQKCLNLWKTRGLLLRGRVVVVNALVLSKVYHALTTCTLPDWALKEIATEHSSGLQSRA